MATNDAYQAALRLLTRREHGVVELARKLRAKGYPDDEIDPVLAQLKAEDYLSDQRFIHNYSRSRLRTGHGPITITQELLAKGIEEPLAKIGLDDFSADWLARAREVRQKKFGQALPDNFTDQAKQMRFLQYRGFTNEQLREVFEPSYEDH